MHNTHTHTHTYTHSHTHTHAHTHTHRQSAPCAFPFQFSFFFFFTLPRRVTAIVLGEIDTPGLERLCTKNPEAGSEDMLGRT